MFLGLQLRLGLELGLAARVIEFSSDFTKEPKFNFVSADMAFVRRERNNLRVCVSMCRGLQALERWWRRRGRSRRGSGRPSMRRTGEAVSALPSLTQRGPLSCGCGGETGSRGGALSGDLKVQSLSDEPFGQRVKSCLLGASSWRQACVPRLSPGGRRRRRLRRAQRPR